MLIGDRRTPCRHKVLSGVTIGHAMKLIDDAQVTDQALRTLRAVGLLQTLARAHAADGKRPTTIEDVSTIYLFNTQVTDAGLKELANLKGLRTLIPVVPSKIIAVGLNYSDHAAEAGIVQRQIPASEMVDRCLYSLVNEGARILEEGYALRAGDIDVIYLNGYGFPAYRGGPMWYADRVGLRKVYERVCEFRGLYGEHWEPARLLKRLAEADGTFGEFHREEGVEV